MFSEEIRRRDDERLLGSSERHDRIHAEVARAIWLSCVFLTSTEKTFFCSEELRLRSRL